MFFPFRRRPTEKEGPDRPPLFDIHNHCLFAIDDGAQNEQDARRMLQGLFQLGFRGVVATPHINHPSFPDPLPKDIEQRLNVLQSGDRVDMPTIITAGEIMVREAFFEVLSREGFPGIGGAFLIEFSTWPGAIGPALEDLLFSILTHGHIPILAHVERYSAFQHDPALLTRCRERGALLQLDLMSLEGRFGERTRQFALRLLERAEIDIAATDIHSPSDLVVLKKSLDTLEGLGRPEFERILSINPGAIFRGHPEDVVSR